MHHAGCSGCLLASEGGGGFSAFMAALGAGHVDMLWRSGEINTFSSSMPAKSTTSHARQEAGAGQIGSDSRTKPEQK